VKFSNKKEGKLVEAAKINHSHPQLVIDFYQSRLEWEKKQE
jgi:hypothetical protein